MIMLEIFLKFLIAMPFILVGIIFIGIGYGAIAFGAKLRRLYKTPCPSCLKPLGKIAVETARKKYNAMQATVKTKPGFLDYKLILWHITCPHCNTQLIYEYERDTICTEATREKPTTTISSLCCTNCKVALDEVIVFCNCKVCVPDAKWFAFTCPHCGEHSDIMVEGEDVLIGLPDGFPEPMFTELGRTRAVGISVNWHEFGADVVYGQMRWSFGVTDAYRQYHSPEYRAEFIRKSKEAFEKQHRMDTSS